MSPVSPLEDRSADVPVVVVLGTQRGVGKSVATGALATVLSRRSSSVGVLKPVSVGCRRTRHGLVSADVEFLAHCADSPHELDVINPIRFSETFVPAECADRSRTAVDFDAIEESRRRVSRGCRLLLIEGVGGLLEPLNRRITMLELAAAWNARVILVASAAADAVNAVLMAAESLQRRNLSIAAVLLNRYRPHTATLADELNPDQIARYAGVPVPFMIPHDPRTSVRAGRLGPDTVAALEPPASGLQAWLADRRHTPIP